MKLEEAAPPRPKLVPEQVVTLHSEDPTVRAHKVARQIAKMIQQQCKPFLKQWGGQLAYRGTDSMPSDSHLAFVRKVRTDRRPRDSDKGAHNMFDMLVALAGKSAARSNSIFCSGDRHQADGYSDNYHSYAVFPIGDFHYTWSPRFKDWSNDENRIRNLFVKMQTPQDSMSRTEQRKVMKLVTKYEKEMGDIYALPAKQRDRHRIKVLDKLLNALEKKLQKAERKDSYDIMNKTAQTMDVAQFDPTKLPKGIVLGDDGTLRAAISSGKEIMINCDKVLYVGSRFAKDFLLPVLNGTAPKPNLKYSTQHDPTPGPDD